MRRSGYILTARRESDGEIRYCCSYFSDQLTLADMCWVTGKSIFCHPYIFKTKEDALAFWEAATYRMPELRNYVPKVECFEE